MAGWDWGLESAQSPNGAPQAESTQDTIRTLDPSAPAPSLSQISSHNPAGSLVHTCKSCLRPSKEACSWLTGPSGSREGSPVKMSEPSSFS